jgi:hypothetical protein
VDASVTDLLRKSLRLQYTFNLKKVKAGLYFPLALMYNKRPTIQEITIINCINRGYCGAGIKTYVHAQARHSFIGWVRLSFRISKYYYRPYDNDGYKFSDQKIVAYLNPHILIGYQHFLFRSFYFSLNSFAGPTFYPYNRFLDKAQFNVELRLGFKI